MTWSEFQQVYKGNIQWTVKTAESEHREKHGFTVKLTKQYMKE